MPLAIRPPRLYRQIPRGPLRVDWSNGLTAGLKAFWTFDATQGGFVDVANHRPLSGTGNPVIVPSAVGSPSVRFDGATQYLSSPSDTWFDAGAVVVLVGVTPRGSIVQNAPIISRWDGSATKRQWVILAADTAGSINGDLSADGTNAVVATTGTGLLVINKRIVIGFLAQATNHGTNQAGQAAVWVDGIRQAQTLSTAGDILTGVNNPVQIGHSITLAGAERFGQYDIDFVAVWNRYMFSPQISSLTRDPGQILIASQPAISSTAPPSQQLPVWRFRPTVDDEQEIWFPPRRTVIADTVPPATALPIWPFRPTVDVEEEIWFPPRRPSIIPPSPVIGAPYWRFRATIDDEALLWLPPRRPTPTSLIGPPRVLIAGQRAPGAYPALPISGGSLDLIMTALDPVRGNYTPIYDTKTYVIVTNTDVVGHTITFTSTADVFDRFGDITAYMIAPGEISQFGPFKSIGWARSGNLWINGSDTHIKVAVVTLS